MKKLIYLIVIALILSLVLTGCLLSNIGQVPTTEQSGVSGIAKNGPPADSICIGFEKDDPYWPESVPLLPGESVEGGGKVHPLLNIYLSGSDNDLVIIEEGATNPPYAYDANVGGGTNNRKNGCLIGQYGIGCINEKPNVDDTISFEFLGGVTVDFFSITILDYGDWIHVGIAPIKLEITPYDSEGNQIDCVISTFDIRNSKYDACGGTEGRKTYQFINPGIAKVQIKFKEGVDRGVGFDEICFIIEPIEVPLDIKPTSCPNPLNTKSKGVTPVAILGTADFDVTDIDPSTIKLAGVNPLPLSWNLEDVATPFEPYTGKEDCYFDCNTEGPDGFFDLTLKFDTQGLLGAIESLYAIGTVESFEVNEEELNALESGVSDQITTTNGVILNNGDCIVIQLEGFLFDGTPIIGEDVVRILKKGNK